MIFSEIKCETPDQGSKAIDEKAVAYGFYRLYFYGSKFITKGNRAKTDRKGIADQNENQN
jgi:hypothetical protein